MIKYFIPNEIISYELYCSMFFIGKADYVVLPNYLDHIYLIK